MKQRILTEAEKPKTQFTNDVEVKRERHADPDHVSITAKGDGGIQEVELLLKTGTADVLFHRLGLALGYEAARKRHGEKVPLC